jgi:hypothetical protein
VIVQAVSPPPTSYGAKASNLAPVITVTGQRPSADVTVIGPAVDRYLAEIRPKWQSQRYFADGYVTYLWPKNVCLEAEGLQFQSEKKFINMMSDRMKAFGLKPSGSCDGTMRFVFSKSYSATLLKYQRNPRLSGGMYNGDFDDLLRIKLPVHWLCVFRHEQNVRLTVIIDGVETANTLATSFLDYLTFVSLSCPNNDLSTPHNLSIANLFRSNGRASINLSRMDMSFLRALYSFKVGEAINERELRSRVISAYAAAADPSLPPPD